MTDRVSTAPRSKSDARPCFHQNACEQIDSQASCGLRHFSAGIAITPMSSKFHQQFSDEQLAESLLLHMSLSCAAAGKELGSKSLDKSLELVKNVYGSQKAKRVAAIIAAMIQATVDTGPAQQEFDTR